MLLVHKGFSQENYLGEGPFDQLIIRGVTLINGDGSPPRGPVDIVVENNIIVAIQVVGYPGVEIEEKNSDLQNTIEQVNKLKLEIENKEKQISKTESVLDEINHELSQIKNNILAHYDE